MLLQGTQHVYCGDSNFFAVLFFRIDTNVFFIFYAVRIVTSEMDFIKARDDDETANLIWNDSAVQHEKIVELRNYQVDPTGQCLKVENNV